MLTSDGIGLCGGVGAGRRKGGRATVQGTAAFYTRESLHWR